MAHHAAAITGARPKQEGRQVCLLHLHRTRYFWKAEKPPTAFQKVPEGSSGEGKRSDLSQPTEKGGKLFSLGSASAPARRALVPLL